MYDKNTITKFINKYFLNGVAPSAQIESDGKDLFTVFRNNIGNFRGEIYLEDINLPKGIIGSLNTDKWLKMLNILDDSFDIEYKTKSSDASIVSVEMVDLKGKKIKYNTAPLTLIDYDGKKGLIKDYDVSVVLNNETIADILKCLNAIETSTIVFSQKKGKLYAIFGNNSSGTDEIEIELDGVASTDFDSISFPSKEIKEILTVNSKAFDNAELNISSKGLLRLLFEEFKLKAEYWLRQNN